MVPKIDLSASLIEIDEFISKFLTENSNSIGFPLALKSCLVLHLMTNVQQICELNFLRNLSQRPYEYVDTVLNIFLLVLNHARTEPVVDRFECDRNECQFMDYLTVEEKRSLRHTIIESNELVRQLSAIIDDQPKFYPFCTVKAYTVLSEVKLDAVSPDELIDAIERRTVDQIDEVKASIVAYAGNHLHKCFGTMSEPNLVRLLTKFREMASPDGIDELRSSVSLVVSRIHRSWASMESILLFGDIILLLLRDECSDIRETMSEVVQRLRYGDTAASEATVLASLAEEQFIDWLDEQFQRLDVQRPWTAWLQLIAMQTERNATESDDVVDEVFDKSESNVFGEVAFVGRKLMKKVGQTLGQSDLCGDEAEKIARSVEADWPELFDCEDFKRN